MTKKLVSILLSVLMLLSITSVSTAETAAEPLNIEFWFGLGGATGDTFLQLIDEYNASQNAVHVTGVQYADYGTTAQNYLASLAAGNPPACLQVQFGSIPTDHLEPLNDRYENDAEFNASDILQGCLASCYGEDGTTILGVPFYATVSLMYYRKDAFEGYDIEETFSSWENLSKAVYEIAKKNDAGETTFYGWEPMWGKGDLIDAVRSAGGDVYTDDTMHTVNFLSDEWVDVASSFSKWINEDKVMRIHYGGTGWEYWYATIDDVMEGRAAGYTGSAGDQGDLDFSIIGAIKQPGWGGHESRASAGPSLMAISKDIGDAEKDAAWDFLKYLSSPSSQGKIAIASGYVVTRKSCLEDPEYAAYIADKPYIVNTIEAVDSAVPYFQDPTGGYVGTAMDDMVDNIEIEGMDPVQALQQCQDEAQAALDEYWNQ